jgi:transposase
MTEGYCQGQPTGRLFLCARCRAQVFICRRCDRGQIYCASGCAQAARRVSLREAAQRYQHSRRGRLAHAQRARRYRLYGMVRERGYQGGPTHFRHLISLHRPRPAAEAYLRLRTLPGEQMQCDWGHFGHLQIGRARRPLMAFVMVLSYSRDLYLRFFLDARMENFLRGHIGAFTRRGGLGRVILYDNLKSAVLERQGEAIRFHPRLLAFAAHYRFEPRPVAIARGNEKGRVERAIRHVRDAFFAARQFTDLDDLNA